MSNHLDIDRSAHEANRLSWNAVTPAHNSHKRDQGRFLREGGSTLFPEEVELLGDLTGKALVHLQCNCGQDTLSLVQRGAIATGVDISDEAVAFARNLSADSGLAANFLRSDVYDWFEQSGPGQFDLAFSSYGAVCWLSNLKAWGRGIAKILKPSGRFVLIDFHPAIMLFDEQMKLTYPYMTGGVILPIPGISDYVAASGEGLARGGFDQGIENFANPHPSCEFPWGLADLITALIDAGLRLDVFREYLYSNGCKLVDGMRPAPGSRWLLSEGVPEIPMMYAITATRSP